MRVAHLGPLLFLVGTLGCVPSLRAGDRAFEEGRFAEAAEAWERDPQEDVAARLFRRALLQLTAESLAFDPPAARRTLEALRAAHPASPYGVAARHALDLLSTCEELEGQLTALRAEIVRLTEQLAARDDENRRKAEAHEVALERLEALEAEERRLQLELQQARDDNARLEQELEALKQIDLRR
ncbi:MAG: hypothetical protein ACOX6T_02130 [Myxococcales bacterium]